MSQTFTLRMPWRRLLREGVVALVWSGLFIYLQSTGSRLDVVAVAGLGDVLERALFWVWSLPWLVSSFRIDREGVSRAGGYYPFAELESARFQSWRGPLGWLVFRFRRGTLWVPTALPGWDRLWVMLHQQRPEHLQEPSQTGLARGILSGELRKPPGIAEPSLYFLKPIKWPPEPSRILTWVRYTFILILVEAFVPWMGSVNTYIAGALLYGFFRFVQVRRDARLWI